MTEETKEKKVAASAKETSVKTEAQSGTKAPQAKKMVEKKNLSHAMIFVKRTGSPIRRDVRQREYLKGLGLSKMNQVRELIDSPEVRGLVRKAQHMVQIVEKA